VLFANYPLAQSAFIVVYRGKLKHYRTLPNKDLSNLEILPTKHLLIALKVPSTISVGKAKVAIFRFYAFLEANFWQQR